MMIPIKEMMKEKKLRNNVDFKTPITIKNGKTTPKMTRIKPIRTIRIGVKCFIYITNMRQNVFQRVRIPEVR